MVQKTVVRDSWPISRREKTHKKKHFIGIVRGLGGGQRGMCVIFFGPFSGKQNPQKMPGQTGTLVVYVF